MRRASPHAVVVAILLGALGCQGPVNTQMPKAQVVQSAPVESVPALAPLRELLTDANLGIHRFMSGGDPQRAFSRWDVMDVEPGRADALRQTLFGAGASSVSSMLVGFRLTLVQGNAPALAVEGRALVLPSHVMLVGLESAPVPSSRQSAPKNSLSSRSIQRAAEGLREVLTGAQCRKLPLLDPQNLGILQHPDLIRVTSQSLARAYRHLERLCLDAEGISEAHIALGELTLLMSDGEGNLRGLLEGKMRLTAQGLLRYEIGRVSVVHGETPTR